MNNKQRVFVEEYLQCWNATEAAKRAGYKHPNVQGTRLLVDISIKAAIEKRIDEKAMSADEVLSRLAEQARGDIGEFMDIESMSFDLDLAKAKEAGITRLIKRVRQRTETTMSRDGSEDKETNILEIELYDAQNALIQLGKHHKLFTDVHELEHHLTIEGLDELLEKVYGRNTDDNQG